MAIVLEEGKKNIDWGFVLGIVCIVVIVGSAVIYLFFVSPETVQQLTTPEQQKLSEFSKAKLNPGEILNSAAFQKLNIVAPAITSEEGAVGKANPFLNN